MKYNGRKVAAAVFWASVAFCVYLTIKFWGSWAYVALVWFLAPVGTMLFAFVAGAIAGIVGAQPMDEPDEVPIDKPELDSAEFQAQVLARSEPLGEYMGVPIYDWMTVRGPNGTEVTLSFARVIPGQITAHDLADGGFIHGRLLYKVKK